eukprot:g3770.t1
MGIWSVSMYGGAPKHDQVSKYRQGVHSIIACPGRLNDLLDGRQVQVNRVRKLVLDEADRMLDMGFEPQIQKILQHLLQEAGLLAPGAVGKCLVFASTKRMCEELAQHLQAARQGRIRVLVATDVAARGLDIKGIGLVVNYDAANNTEDYVHRIGRTGRAGNKGFAVTFLSPHEDSGKASGIVQVMESTNQHISDELRSLARRGGGGGRSRWGGGRGGKGSGGGGGGGSRDCKCGLKVVQDTSRLCIICTDPGSESGGFWKLWSSSANDQLPVCVHCYKIMEINSLCKGGTVEPMVSTNMTREGRRCEACAPQGRGRGKGAGDGAKATGKSGNFFGGGGYASFGDACLHLTSSQRLYRSLPAPQLKDYMVDKNRKLKEQFASAAEAGSAGSATKTAIFQGLSFWMTGRTCLPDQELKRIIVEHGGVYEQYGFTHVTHVIADNLASGNQTWAQLKRRTKRVNVVTSSWVMDCVKEGRRIPELRYMPACLSTPSSMLSFMDRKQVVKTLGCDWVVLILLTCDMS